MRAWLNHCGAPAKVRRTITTAAMVCVLSPSVRAEGGGDDAHTHSREPSSGGVTKDETPYFQGGISLAAEFVLAPGKICSIAEPCILGSGGGFAARAGYRSASPWYLGGAYELTKQDPNNLYRLATLQQVRLELRYYVETGRDVTPLFTTGAGVAGYGNEWSIDTWGPLGFVGGGVELQVSRTFVIGLQAAYRALATQRFGDPGTSNTRPAGVASLFALELVLEGRDPLKR